MSATSDGAAVRLASGDLLHADHVVLCAGAHATAIKGSGAEHLPLGVERGYHLQFDGAAEQVTRPVGWAEGGFYATPMAQGLRCAGTVEIASRNAPPNPKRIAYLRKKAEQMFGPIDAAATPWLGLRPTFPDSLPAIGPSPQSDRILLAFGHQHLGLTLSGTTGQMVAEMAQGRRPNMDLTPYSAGRFTSA